MNTEMVILNTQTVSFAEKQLDIDPRISSAATKQKYLGDIRIFEQWRDGTALSKMLVERYASHLTDSGLAIATVNRKLSAIRWLASRIIEMAHETISDPLTRAEIIRQAVRVTQVANVRGGNDSEVTGTHINIGEMTAIMDACTKDPLPQGIRDAALFAILWQTGCRISEVLGLRLGDWSQIDENHGTLTVKGKGNKTRKVFVYGAMRVLNDWLDVRGGEDGFIFCPINKGGRIFGDKSISQPAAHKLRKKRLGAASVRDLNWHDFRRTLVGDMFSANVDVATIQKMVGHASPATTSRYDRRGIEVRMSASQIKHVPYKPMTTNEEEE